MIWEGPCGRVHVMSVGLKCHTDCWKLVDLIFKSTDLLIETFKKLWNIVAS